jgi:hypothetical protein
VLLLQVRSDLPNPAKYEADRVATPISTTIISIKIIDIFIPN